MTDRLHQELLAVPGLEQVTALQLQELPWKTREQILVALFDEHTTSVAVSDELRRQSRDRRLERKTQKAENAERDVVRKNEERFRSKFMQTAATELARLGAPAMITWQKLVFDRDCCAQAFRLLLTKIKSAKRSSSSASSGNQSMRRPIVLAKRFTSPEDGGPSVESDDWENADASTDTAFVVAAPHYHSEDTVLPRILSGMKSTVKPPHTGLRRPSQPSTPSEWNADTTMDDTSSRLDDERRDDDPRSVAFGSAEISIQRTTVKPGICASTSAFAAKLKKSQLASLQQANAALTNENATLRNEISHLEALVATLQTDNNQAASAQDRESAHYAQMKILQAQNMQLQRQIGLIQDAIVEREIAESMLLSALSHWREVIASGREEANAAGADAQAKAKDGKPVQWMLAVPERLLDELARVESQIDQANKTMGVAHNAKLRVGGTAAEFLKLSTSSSVPFNAIYVPGIAHLRVERVKALEASLAQVVRAVESLYDQIVQLLTPKMANGPNTSSASAELTAVLTSLRTVAMEVSGFGIVVPSVKGSFSLPRATHDDGPLVTVAQVLAAYTAAAASTSGMSAKDREKQLKTMLKQLQASESAAQREREQLYKEAIFWRDAWAMQEQLLRSLVQRVRSVGDNKMQWAESSLVHPLRELHEVWTSFQRTQQSQQDQRLHKNAYFPLLIDTLQRHTPVMCLEAIDQWQQVTTRYNHELGEIFADYDANCVLLKSYVKAPAIQAQVNANAS